MGGVLDFLTQGTAPPSVNSSGTSSTNLPGWLNEYALNTMAQANQIAATPYTPYQGPRIAGFTNPQNQAFDLAQNNVGNWQPGVNQASQTFNNPNTVSSYMNPYTNNVINQGTNLAMQNYNQNLKPALDNQFTSAGQYGSSAHERAANQMGNQLTQNIQDQNQAALASAYNTGNQNFNTDMSRIGNLAQLRAQLGGQDVANLSNVGAQQQQQNQGNLNLAYQDFQNQLNWPKTQMGWLQNSVSQLPYGQTTTSSNNGPLRNADYGVPQAQQLASGASTLTGIYQSLFGGNGTNGSSSTPSYAMPINFDTPNLDNTDWGFNIPKVKYGGLVRAYG